MRNILFIFTVLATFKLCGQEIKAKDSTIYLQEVIITTKGKNQKILEVKTKGTSATATLPSVSEFVTLVGEIPKGKLRSIKFYFNPGLTENEKRKRNVAYKKLELELLIYQAENGIPTELITKDVRFIVDDQEKATIELDLSYLDIASSPNLFLGIGIIDPSITRDMILQCLSSKSASTFYKVAGHDDWVTFYEGMGINIKLVLTIEE